MKLRPPASLRAGCATTSQAQAGARTKATMRFRLEVEAPRISQAARVGSTLDSKLGHTLPADHQPF